MVKNVGVTEQIADSNWSNMFQIEKYRVRLLHMGLRVHQLFCKLKIAIFEIVHSFQEAHQTANRRFAVSGFAQNAVQLFQKVRAKDLGFFILTYNVDQAWIEEKHIVAAFVPDCASLTLNLVVGSDRTERVKPCSSDRGYVQILNCVQVDWVLVFFKLLDLFLWLWS